MTSDMESGRTTSPPQEPLLQPLTTHVGSEHTHTERITPSPSPSPPPPSLPPSPPKTSPTTTTQEKKKKKKKKKKKEKEPLTAHSKEPHNPAPILDYWPGWDILGLTLSLAILIAIVVILRTYDGQQQPTWRGVSLNTVLSWLSTVAKGCIAFPLSSGLSQLKWVWFAKRARPLSDLRVFDNASRGVYGSLELVLALRMRHFAVVGAIAVVLAVGFDPFVQNLVHYSSDLVVDTSRVSRLANATYYDTLGPLQTSFSNYFVEPTLKANIYNSIFSTDPSRPWAIPQYTCPSGNCTWDPVASLAVRALCTDITSSIQQSCIAHNDTGAMEMPYKNCTVSLPHDGAAAFYAGGIHTEAIALQVKPVTEPVVYTKHNTLLVIQRIEARAAVPEAGHYMAQDIRDDGRYVATECALELVVRSVQAQVSGSVYSERMLAEWNGVDVWYDENQGANGSSLVPEWDDRSLLGGAGGGVGNFTLFPKSQATIVQFLEPLFSGEIYSGMMSLIFRASGDQLDTSYATADVMEALLLGNITGCADVQSNRFSCAMHNVADALSKSFRDQAYINSGAEMADMALGHTQVNATIVHVRWQWLTLPVLVWMLGGATWLGAEWKTRRGKLHKWSDNPLPLLFLYREGQGGDGNGGGGANTVQGLGLSGQAYERRAKRIHARLYTDKDRAEFVE
ncbi:hypothetical protein RU639_009324 [Aspergillus parasiticus]